MSKSLNNCILLGSNEQEISQAVQSMYTDPNHIRVSDPGQLEGNIVFTYLDAFHPDAAYIDELKSHYQAGGLGDGATKKLLNQVLQELLRPIRERREIFLSDKSQLVDILKLGSERSQDEASLVLAKIKRAFGLNLF